MSSVYNSKISKLHSLLAERKVVFFQPDELLFLGGSHWNGKAVNRLPADNLLEKLADVAVQADMLRARCGFPLKVVSAYRTPGYNKAIKGASRSLHMHGRALDLMPVSMQRIDTLRSKAKELHREKSLYGGLGLYASFVHLDTGKHRSWGR